jgi:hypothetical protein
MAMEGHLIRQTNVNQHPMTTQKEKLLKWKRLVYPRMTLRVCTSILNPTDMDMVIGIRRADTEYLN